MRGNKTMRFGTRTWLRLAEPRSGTGAGKRFPQCEVCLFSSRRELRLDFFEFAKNTAGMNRLFSAVNKVVVTPKTIRLMPGGRETELVPDRFVKPPFVEWTEKFLPVSCYYGIAFYQ
jgi:hypothetical protein